MKTNLNIKRIVPFTISALMIVTVLLLQFTVLSVNKQFNWREFVPQLLINTALITTTAIVWLNPGTDRAKIQEKSAYKDNAALYAAQIKKITDGGQLANLRAFCKVRTEQIRNDKITVLLANVGIDRHLYDSTLKDLDKDKLKADGYTKRQINAIERVRDGKVRVKPINAMDLVSDSRTVDDCGVNYNERADKSIRISLRIGRSVLTAFALALFVPDLAKDITSIAAWAMFFVKLCTIVYTAFSSEREGYTRITETKNRVILRRIAFLHEFDEWASVPKLYKGNEDKDVGI